jgi:ATP/maltotriose-dependent transcriptional regulator MalT
MALLAQHDVLWGPDTPEARLALVAEITQLAEAARDEELLAEAHLLRCTALLELGDPRAPVELRRFAARAHHSSQPRVRWLGRSREATLAVLAGDLGEAERLVAEITQRGEELGIPDTPSVVAGLPLRG